MIATVNPATGETVATFEALTEPQLEEKLARSAAAYRAYRRTTFADRARWMERAAAILETERDAFGRMMTLEMGKPLEAARQEAAKCALACRYYVEHGERLLADEPVDLGGPRAFLRYQPIGPVLAVMPWNFPFWQVFRFLAPALMAGNVGLLKHSSNVPQCALAIEDIVRRAGFPADVFQTLLIGSDTVRRVIEDLAREGRHADRQRAGGAWWPHRPEADQEDRARTRRQRSIHCHASAPLDAAVRTAVQSRVINNGQSCIAAKRFIVDEAIAGEFESKFVDAMRRLVVGDPMAEATQIGPLATRAIRDELDNQVRRSVTAGARVLTGGHAIDGPSHFYAPTVLVDAPAGSPACCEEFFGPVAVIRRAAGIEDAIRIANDTPFGLGASAWTTDAAEQERFIEEIETGMVFVNGMVASRSAPSLRWGEDLGLGRGAQRGASASSST